MIELLHDDCMNVMAKYPDKYFEIAIVDPPYGINFAAEKERASGQFKFTCKNWDSAIPNKEYFTELFRVSKNQIIWGGNYFLDYLPKTNCIIIWDKLNPPGMKFSDGEMAWASFNTSLRILKIPRTYMMERQIHPTQKPIQLYNWLLDKYAKPGDKILDTHLGSGSIAIACHNIGFDLVGIEIDKDYYNEASKRFKEQTMQEYLFPKKIV